VLHELRPVISRQARCSEPPLHKNPRSCKSAILYMKQKRHSPNLASAPVGCMPARLR